MVKVNLIIKCWQCGKEEKVVEILEDSVVDFNLDKCCSHCNSGWMIKKELSMTKLGQVNDVQLSKS